jgi:hypothetical protein
MFGRPLPPAPPPSKQHRVSPRQRSIPPGLVPFVPVLAIVLVLIATLVEPVAGLVLLVVLLAAIIRMRYRFVRGVDYYTLRGRDPLYRSLDDFRHGRNRYRDADRPPK